MALHAVQGVARAKQMSVGVTVLLYYLAVAILVADAGWPAPVLVLCIDRIWDLVVVASVVQWQHDCCGRVRVAGSHLRVSVCSNS